MKAGLQGPGRRERALRTLQSASLQSAIRAVLGSLARGSPGSGAVHCAPLALAARFGRGGACRTAAGATPPTAM
eukprot:14842285-Alexandrium_andersonii.AAC.1